MYKKITHNIVEEHFAHPAAAEIKAHIDSASTSSRFYHSTSTHYTTSSTHIQSTGTNLHHNAIAVASLANSRQWLNFNNINQNIYSALSNDIAQVPFLKADAMKNIDEIGQFVQQHYGVAAGRAVVKALTDFEVTLINLMTAVSQNKDRDISDLKEVIGNNITELGKTFSSINPVKWTNSAIVSAFDQYVTLISEATSAQMKKRWEELNRVTTNIRKLINSVSDVFMSGFPVPMPLEKKP